MVWTICPCWNWNPFSCTKLFKHTIKESLRAILIRYALLRVVYYLFVLQGPCRADATVGSILHATASGTSIANYACRLLAWRQQKN
eukprot:scaffold23846_cov122-Cylindrotheca_fusiformis.AAC.1